MKSLFLIPLLIFGSMVLRADELDRSKFVLEKTSESTAENFSADLQSYGFSEKTDWDTLAPSERDSIRILAGSPKIKDRIRAAELAEKFHLWFLNKKAGQEVTSVRQYLIDALKVKSFESVDVQSFERAILNLGFSGAFSHVSSSKYLKKYLAGRNAPQGRLSAIESFIQLVSPHNLRSKANISMIPNLREVGRNILYQRAAIRLALRVLSRKNLSSISLAKHSLIDDTEESFREVGVPQSDLRKHALKLLGLWATRGVGFNYFFYSDWSSQDSVMKGFHLPLFTAISIMAANLPVLDMMTLPEGRPYSLPKEITCSANYTKYYHFWFSALGAQLLTKLGFSADDTLEAIHRLGVAYEVFAYVRNNRPDQLVENGGFYVTESKEDIYFNGLGATWSLASSLGIEKSISADDQLYKILTPASIPEHSDPQEFVKIKANGWFWQRRYQRSIGEQAVKMSNLLRPFTVLPEWKAYLTIPQVPGT